MRLANSTGVYFGTHRIDVGFGQTEDPQQWPTLAQVTLILWYLGIRLADLSIPGGKCVRPKFLVVQTEVGFLLPLSDHLCIPGYATRLILQKTVLGSG